MTRDTTAWHSDPAVEAGFAAAYAPEQPAEPADAWEYAGSAPAPTAGEDVGGTAPDGGPEDVPAAADALPRPAVAVPLTRDGLRARAPEPEALSPLRALTGAAVAVAGVALGIGTLLWATDGAPADDPVVGSLAQSDRLGDVGLEEGPEAVAPPAAPSPAAVAPTATQAPVPAQPTPAPAQQPPPADVAPAVAPLTVLNNSQITGLADRAAARFRAGGWPIRQTGNLRGRIRATTVYYAPGQEAQARELARAFRGIERVLPRLDGLPGRGLTVVVTRDFPA